MADVKKIAVVPGDGIGPEIVAEALKTLAAVARRFSRVFETETFPTGGAAIDATGEPLPDATLRRCRAADAVLLGAVGGPKWDGLPGPRRPERALLGLRAGLGLSCNLRPVKLWRALADASPLKSAVLGDGVDLLIVRELTGGVYFGAHERSADGDAGARTADLASGGPALTTAEMGDAVAAAVQCSSSWKAPSAWKCPAGRASPEGSASLSS